MNIEELSKAQLILLGILVSFVTSVATGIITVSLLDQAPPIVTQTVHQVVEKTIQTVTEAAPTPAAVAAAPAPAPSDQDLVTGALGADASRVADIYDASDGTSSPATAVGTFLPGMRMVATVTQDNLPANALIGLAGGAYATATIANEGGGIVLYSFGAGADLPKGSDPTLDAASSLALGETALAIGADGSASTGIVALVGDDGITTTLPDIAPGSAVVDLSGNLMGLANGAAAGKLVSADAITALITATTTATSTASGS